MWCRLLPLLLFLWGAFSTYWYVCEIKDNNCTCFKQSTATPATASGFVLKDGDKILFQSDKNFYFNKSSQQPQDIGELSKGLEVLSAYMKQHPNKTIELTGLYAGDEKNPSKAVNLGAGRADELKKTVTSCWDTCWSDNR